VGQRESDARQKSSDSLVYDAVNIVGRQISNWTDQRSLKKFPSSLKKTPLKNPDELINRERELRQKVHVSEES
jgi:hypothetical protein